MFFQLLYLVCFLVLGALAFYSMVIGWRQRQGRRPSRLQAHPELLDRQGRVIKDPLLVVRVTPRDVDIRSRLEALYERSPDEEQRPEDR